MSKWVKVSILNYRIWHMYIMTIVNVFALVIHTMFNKSWIYVSYMHAMCIFNIFITYTRDVYTSISVPAYTSINVNFNLIKRFLKQFISYVYVENS